MNIFNHLENELTQLVNVNLKILRLQKANSLKNLRVEVPPSKVDFDLSTNAALLLGKENNLDFKKLGNEICKIIDKSSLGLTDFKVEDKGFINFNFKKQKLLGIINTIMNEDKNFGKSLNKKKINVEYVSANPTGPLHVGHCRGAVFGDVVSNLLSFYGYDVIREYYINDHGNQIYNFTKSVYYRIKEITSKTTFPDEKDLYPGEYIKEIANKIIDLNKDNKNLDFKKDFKHLKNLSLKFSMNLIKDDLKKLKIVHDKFVSETELIENKRVEETINYLKEKNYIEENILPAPKGINKKDWIQKKKLIFKSTSFGDDLDRALTKDDGSWTYFASDTAYHYDKINRGFELLINILGADHAGYVKRITSAVEALSKNKTFINCKVCRLVKLFKNGKPFKMSKRSGEFINVSDLLNEVSSDNIRFIMLSKSNDVEIEFDFNKIIEKNKDNHVYYIQYANARINSLFETLGGQSDIKLDINKELNLNIYEKKIFRKVLEWPHIIQSAVNKLEPHKIPFYLYDLANLFHSYWSAGAKNSQYKFIKKNNIEDITFSIIKLVHIVIQNGMKILGVNLPKKM